MANFLNVGAPTSEYTDVVNIAASSQRGIMIDPTNWSDAMYYARPELRCVLLQAPLGFKWFSDGTQMAARLKALVETKASEITGITATLNNNFEDVAVSNGGEVIQVNTGVTRERTNPSFTFNDYKGLPVYKDFSRWIRGLFQEPLTGRPGIISEQAYIRDQAPPLTPRDQTATMLFYLVSDTMRGVDYACMCTNMAPMNLTFEANKTTPHTRELQTYTIPFTAFTLHSDDVPAVADVALEYINSLNSAGFSPASLPAFTDDVDPDIDDITTGNGYREFVDRVGQGNA